MWNVRVDKTQARIKIATRNINNLRYAHDTTLIAESKEELKSLLMKVKEESKKAGLKLNIQKTKITASGSITSWQIDGETMKHCTADSDCSHEIKGCLLLWRKAMKNLHSLLKSKDSIFLTKVYLVKAMVFSVVMYRCESWTIKKAECWRIDAFELWCWRRLLRVPWTAKRSNQSILKKINPEYSLEVLMLKLKLHTLATWFEELTLGKDHDTGKDLGQEEKGTTEDEMVSWNHWFNGRKFEQTQGGSEGQGHLACKESDTT